MLKSILRWHSFIPPPFAEEVGQFFRTFGIKGWVANFLGLKFALQNFEVGGTVLIEKMHTPETKKYHISKKFACSEQFS